MTALLAATTAGLAVGWLLLIVGVVWLLVCMSRPDSLEVEWDEIAAGPGPFILADGPDERTPLYDATHLSLWEREFGEDR